MSVWNNRKLHRPGRSFEPTEAFNTILRPRLGEYGDRAWAIYKKFADLGIGFDAGLIINTAFGNKKPEAGIEALEALWQENVEGGSIPSREDMTPAHEELLANCFLMADLKVSRGY
ncbi:MAG: hypothetical protein A3A33_01880 [Candidatus Yanofskybacteria bacterium RIFCSPLOWO2_01_FULL_49_25]|uniref:Uncharacterized protein n=1 Tax=Candidatus Yanofskybacteria bacterium RIFCSPLOWO2_01_FULL_49_25 TaxID=1802701 RepID=A0A1F8GW43_9BACT|nr:MAG: hypothetical protein A3A33_01880 [Candidatus Yanofskybacteria bacterium RIFCSPLOWO2_01_FULL_49_25]